MKYSYLIVLITILSMIGIGISIINHIRQASRTVSWEYEGNSQSIR